MNQPRVKIIVWLPEELVAEALSSGIDIDAAAEAGICKAIELAKQNMPSAPSS